MTDNPKNPENISQPDPVGDGNSLSVRRRLLSGAETWEHGPYPFAGQVLERQRRKHESIRGSESRIVRSAGSSNYTGIVPLFCLQAASKAFESLIEHDFWVVLDYVMRDVIDARAQPGVMELSVLGKKEKWYPDMWIRRKNRRDLLVECKPASLVHPDPAEFPNEAAYMEHRIGAMGVAANAMDMDFELFTEIEIRIEPRLHNAKMMRRGLSSHVPAELENKAKWGLRSLPRLITIREFSRSLGDYAGAAMAIACCLDRHGHIELDNASFLTPEATFINRMAVG